jgi:hypothetical protein
MKYSLPFFVLVPVLLTVSCTRYQYLTISSNSAAVEKNARNQFILENDSLVIMYDFKGAELPLGIRVTNKQNEPVMIDWKRSSIIINDEAVSLMPQEAVTRGIARSESVSLNRANFISYTYTDMNAVTSLPADLQQIPPRSFIMREPLKVHTRYFEIPKGAYVKKRLELENGSKLRVREVSYTKEQSPLQFRTFLTLVTQGEGRLLTFEHDFYVSGIVSSGQSLTGDDRPYVSKGTVFSDVASTVSAVALIGGAAAVAVANPEKNEKKVEGK